MGRAPLGAFGIDDLLLDAVAGACWGAAAIENSPVGCRTSPPSRASSAEQQCIDDLPTLESGNPLRFSFSWKYHVLTHMMSSRATSPHAALRQLLMERFLHASQACLCSEQNRNKKTALSSVPISTFAQVGTACQGPDFGSLPGTQDALIPFR